MPLNSSHRFTWCPVLMCPGCALSRLAKAHGSGLATWMQTVGTVLLTVKPCSLVRMGRSAQDSRNVHGLLYLAAVWDDWREEEHRQGMIDTDPRYMDQGPAK